jgi:DNA-binding PadR family transcriptional regulator
MSARISTLGRALLGLLLERPLSGYDIRMIFTRTPMGSFSDSPGAIYPALERLQTAGLIRGRVENSAGLRRRKTFQLTPAGQDSLKRWLSAPVTREDVVHDTDELLLRFSFMDAGLGETASVRFLTGLQHELKGYIPELQRYLEAHRREMPRSGRLALESGIRAYETLHQWTGHALTAYAKRGNHVKGRKRS